MAKIKLHDVSITARTVEVPATCPADGCSADLTQPAAIEEQRLCTTLARSHLGTDDPADALSETDTADVECDCAATTDVRCARCGHKLAAGRYVVDGAEAPSGR